MTTIIGTIETIQYYSNYTGKVVLTIRPDEHQTAYIELRGKRAILANKLTKGCRAKVDFVFCGKKAKTTKQHYNNLVGRNVTIINE